MKTLLIWGAGDQGIVTLECALAMNIYHKIEFLTFKEKGHRSIPGYLIHCEEQVSNTIFNNFDEVIVATGDNNLREEKTLKLLSLNIPLATIIHPSAIISPSATVSKGTTILCNTVINTNAYIASGCIINNGSIIEHDCRVEEYTNICPKVAMAGHTTIGKKAFIGIGANIIDDIHVGNNVTIGAGAVVINDILDNVTVVGVPAKIKSNK